MSDQGLRALERALAAGEEAARLPLATAYLRQGRCGAAAGLLAGQVALPADAQPVLQAAWYQTLAELRPRGRVPGVRPWGTALAWEEDGRRAVLRPAAGGSVSHTLERETLQVVVTREPPGAQPAATRPPEPDPRLVPRVTSLLRRHAPARLAGAHPRLGQRLPDGRLVWADPLAVLDLDALPEPRVWVLEPGGRFEGPARLSADGAALLGFVEGRPARIPLRPGPRRAPSPPGEGSGVWHPRADAAVTLPPRPRPCELVTAEGQLLLRFPPDARPLGFTPSGLTLLVLRAFLAPDTGVLELWGAGEEVAA